MTKVDAQEIMSLKKRLSEINRIPFDEIEWMDGDKPLEVAMGAKEDFRFLGLSNVDFVWAGVYQGLVDLEEPEKPKGDMK